MTSSKKTSCFIYWYIYSIIIIVYSLSVFLTVSTQPQPVESAPPQDTRERSPGARRSICRCLPPDTTWHKFKSPRAVVFVAASHQTRLDTRSKARRLIKVGIKGRGRSGRSRDSNPACLCCSSAHLVQCEPDEASSFTNPNVGPGTYASKRLLTLMVFHWSLSDNKPPQVSKTLLSILAVLNSVVIWMVSTRPLIFNSPSPFNNPLVTVPKAPITIGIIVIFMSHSFFNSLARPWYLSFLSFSFN